MNNCICHTEAVALGYADCDYCEAVIHDDEVVTYDDLIEDQDRAVAELLANEGC